MSTGNPDKSASPHIRPPAGRRGATVAVAFVHGLLAGITGRGFSPLPLLADVDIDPRVLLDATARVPIERYAALYNRVNRELDDEAFGLFSTPMRGGSFEFLSRSVVTAPTLEEALRRAARFLRLVLPDLAVEIERDHDEARLSLREVHALGRGRVFAFEWLLRLLHGLSSWLVGRGIVLDAVEFPYARPAHADDYALIYTEHSSFGHEVLCARFAANLLELPIRRDEAALQGFLQGAPGRLTMLYRRDREMVLRVRDLLRAALPAAMPLTEVARRLHLSPRTLHRRLEDEGSSFQAIKDALRRDVAINRLTKTRQPLSRIAADLGYADPSAFYRAFVGWTGMAPAHYRRRLRELAAPGT